MSSDQPTAPGRASKPAAPSRATWKQKRFHGPVDIDWLAAAARLPGRSLHVGVALVVAAKELKALVVPLSNTAGLKFGLDRNAKYRGLAWLEKAGLVSVKRKLGRSPLVTIIEVGGDQGLRS